ncbi:MAG TPA: ATP-grasp domain-containing protein, partial [Roseiarcus sp.]|nr:ATP-grasp domain-containing protein [Roseiarcus sp.]
GRFGYRGGRIPAVDLSPVLAAAAVDLVADACRSLPGLVGYVGFDLIASANAPHVRIVEVNPRLTTSYVGYRELTRENLAARMFSSVVGWDKLAQRAPAHRFAGNNFEDQDGGPAAGGPALSHPTKSIQCVDFDPDGTVRVV